jgi:hypothetical protein
MLRRPKCSKNEVVAPKEEEEDMQLIYNAKISLFFSIIPELI